MKCAFNCRTEKKRMEIVRDYTLTPYLYTRLLNGQTKMSCTGDKLTDKYYLFEYVGKSNPKDTGTFYCGSLAANHFLQLIGNPDIQEFNPLKASTSVNGSSSSGNSGTVKTKWNDVAKELYNAICLLTICWDTHKDGPLLKIKAKLERYKYSAPYFSQVKAVNTMISKDPKNRTLTQMIEELRLKNPTLKEYSFEKLKAILNEKQIKSLY